MAESKFTFSGIVIKVKGYSEADWIFETITKYNTFYEIDLLRYMKFALKNRDGYIIDIGANIGNHSLFFGLIMQKKVVCFEPNPPIFEILDENMKTNHIQYKAYQIGLGATRGTYVVDSKHKAADDNIGAAKLCMDEAGDIEVHTLDEMQKEFRYQNESLLAIKADIEGMEAEMLKGAIGTLVKEKPDLFLEIANTALMDEIEEILSPIGYEKLYAYAGTPVWHFAHESKLPFSRQFNLYCYHFIMKIKEKIGKVWKFVR